MKVPNTFLNQAIALFCAAAFFLASGGCSTAPQEKKTARQPNIVFILADDLGYADLGAFGQKKIRTPNIDRMAVEGMRFTRHYSGSPVCAPSRCVLLTGKHPGHAAVRDNREIKPEGQVPLPAAETTIAELLKKEGYVSGAFGKWGLGNPESEGSPLRQGFDRFYGYNCQRHAHSYYPTYLYDDNARVPLRNAEFNAPRKLPASADPKDPESYRPYEGKDYAPDLIGEQALKFIRDNKEKPFFLYFATPVPHLALQVPEDSLAEYERHWPDEPYVGGNGYLPHRTPRAAYAAMITRLDRDVGRLMALVKELGLDENTIFVFTSDNGPLYDRLGGTDTDFFQSAGSLRGRKGSLYEGGIRVPMIVRWKGRIASATTSDRVTGFEDWMPSLRTLTGAKVSLPDKIDGIDFTPTLFGQLQQPRDFLYREFPGYGGQQMVLMGDWKGVRQQLNPKDKNVAVTLRTELYDLKRDPNETTDVSKSHPEVLKKIERLMRQQRSPSELFPLAALD